MERIVYFYNLIFFVISVWLLWDLIFGWTIRNKKSLYGIAIILLIAGCFASITPIGLIIAFVLTILLIIYSLFLVNASWWEKIIVTTSAIILVGSLFELWKNAISLLSNEKIGLRYSYFCAFLIILIFGIISKMIFKNVQWKMKLLPMVGMSIFFLLIDKYLLGYSYAFLDSEDYSIRFDIALAELGIVVLFMLCVVFIGNIFAKSHYQQMVEIREEYLAVQGKYYESIEEKNQSVRKLRHDMKNHMIVVQTLLEAGKIDEAKEYMKEFAAKIEDTDAKVHTGNPIVDAIIMDKMLSAKDKGIEILVEGLWSYDTMTSVDICTLLANIIDNAIEASEKAVKDKKIDISFKRTEQFFSISCMNHCLSDLVWKDGVIESTKEDKSHHGFGMRNITEVCEKYAGNMDVKCDEIDALQQEKQFSITLIFPIQA